MTGFVYVNNFNTTLAAAASSTATTMSVASSTNLPTLGPGEIMPMTLNDAATGQVYEIVYVTAISGTTLTVERAQEGTVAQNWSVGDYTYCAFTAESVPLVTRFLHTPTASESITPVALNTVVQPGTITAAITLTIEPGTVVGQEVEVFGSASAYAVTVQSSVTTGSPYFEYPDNSTNYSWVIPASSPGQSIKLVWDGANYRATTHGQSVSAPATQSNANVTLGQVLAVSPVTAQQSFTPASGGSTALTVSFTAPTAGFVISIYGISETQQPVNGTLQASFNGVNGNSDISEGSMLVFGVNTVSAGEVCTATNTYTADTTTATFTGLVQNVLMIFIPNP